MRDREPSIDFDDLPEIQAEPRDNARAEQARALKKPMRSPEAKTVLAPVVSSGAAGPSAVVVYSGLGIVIAALAFLAFQLYAQTIKLDTRVQDLEARLSTTDASLNQSGVAMQVQIKELKDRVMDQESQISKLWDSAWKKNQKEIDQLDKKLAALAQSQKKSVTEWNEQAKAIEKANETISAELKVVMARTDTLSAMDAGIKEQAQKLADMKTQLANMTKANDALRKKVEENVGWIESNNMFRQQTNQSLNRIEQQLKAMQSKSSSTTTIITP